MGNTHGTAKVDTHGRGDAGNFDEDEDGGKAKGGVGFGRNAASKKAHSHKIKAEKVYFFDYNTVETVLLGCAVLVCLSGVMFENERFQNRTDVLWEKEVMTWCVFGVIFGSIIYYGVVFISEVFGYTPKCIQRMC